MSLPPPPPNRDALQKKSPKIGIQPNHAALALRNGKKYFDSADWAMNSSESTNIQVKGNSAMNQGAELSTKINKNIPVTPLSR